MYLKNLFFRQEGVDFNHSAEASEVTNTGNASLTKNADLSEVNLSPQDTENIELTTEADIVPEVRNFCFCSLVGKVEKNLEVAKKNYQFSQIADSIQ